ncbi:CoA pyrophosphatase [Leeia sp. TBRC 13508]|uniref:CoA pyrophosphatase n=1 Tax=Leeia speluncae TaxID=2884804 RepID=A0ABS8D238_9NEIS|nr:CoA pyrophosphatase [Leeia speluncae]MCB6182257.1 CoA pyrophosphatase [Leeia speluncae]
MNTFQLWSAIDRLNKEELTQLLTSCFSRSLSNPTLVEPASELRQAAVLIPFIIDDGKINILLTKRSLNLPSHQGQVCFPGGKVDLSDRSTTETALRETFEEIGIAREDIRPIGALLPLPTVSQFNIHPIIGLISRKAHYNLSTSEVEQVFELPLLQLLNPDALKKEKIIRWQKEHTIHVIAYNGFYIWGATASLLVQLRELILSNASFAELATLPR